MSEIINNREYRQKVLKELIQELHEGKSVEEVKPRFEKLIEGISASEIAEMEQALIMEGMPVEEIQRLCDVHAAVFKGSIEDIHREQVEEEGTHPVSIFKEENKLIEEFINNEVKVALEEFNLNILEEKFKKLLEIDHHYARKENLIFPYLEKYGITAPPQVMWGVDDEIRDGIKDVLNRIRNYNGQKDALISKAKEVIDKILEMVFKEENILFPMALDTLTEDEWVKISQETDEFSYTFIEPPKGVYKGSGVVVSDSADSTHNTEEIPFDAGYLSPKEVNAILNTLPIDITFVDKSGKVKYFSQGQERIFPRPKTVLGRDVSNCHPPSSVHIVEKIVEDLASGKKEHEDFWIHKGNQYAHIRYFAVRDREGEFLGVVEMTQDIKPIQEIKGEKRLVED